MKGDDKPECFKYAYNNSNSFHAVSFSIIKHFELIHIFYLMLFCTKYERRKSGDD